MSTPEPKTCASCGRRIEWRKKWERDWDSVRYCSTACRRHGVSEVDRSLEATILSLLAQRARGKTICPSDAARVVGGAVGGGAGGVDGGVDAKPGSEPWRELMEPARRAARRLVASGDVVITQGGKVVDPSTAKGAIRIRRA